VALDLLYGQVKKSYRRRRLARVERRMRLSEDWAMAERARLQEAFQEAVLALAQLYLDRRQYEAVIDCCQRALAEDHYLEEAYRLTMRAYAALGNPAAVTRQFERCRQVLTEELNTPISPQTKALYESLIRR
jgi:DNA-binding SARP family transcriptional activator